MRKIVFCTIALLAATTVSIQAQTVRDVRRVKTTALSLYEKYVHSLGVLHDGGKYTGDNFIDLFVDPGEVIYNDIIPANHPQITNAYGYYTIYDSVIKYANYEYSGFRFNNPQKEGNKWVIDCFFTRTVSFNTRDSVYSHYPAWNFNYTMRITMDNQIAIVGNRNGIKEYDPDSLFANPKIVSITVDQPIEEGDLYSFEIADQGNVFHNLPIAAIGKGNVITLLNPAFTPTAVRYAWKDDPKKANVRSLSGLPMSSFELKLKK